MPTIKLISGEEEIEAEAVYEKQAKKFGKGSSHVILPAKWIGYSVKIIVMPLVGQFAAGYEQAAKRLDAEDAAREARKKAKKRR